MELIKEALEGLKESYGIDLMVFLDREGEELWRMGQQRAFSRSTVKKSMEEKAPVAFF